MAVLRSDLASPPVAAEHFAAKLAVETDPADVHAAMAGGAAESVVIDVRSRDAYREAHVPGAISLPYQEISASTGAAALGSARYAVVYCWGIHCNAGTKGALLLAELGIAVKEMLGGLDGWRREGLAVATGDQT
jgi:rhodanese-related sulfurtransferase